MANVNHLDTDIVFSVTSVRVCAVNGRDFEHHVSDHLGEAPAVLDAVHGLPEVPLGQQLRSLLVSGLGGETQRETTRE